VNNLVAAGIFYVAAAGNAGPNCGTIAGPPAIYDASFVVGSTDSSDALNSFGNGPSSRGPITGDPLIRPDVVAPGVSVYSSIPTNGYGYKTGTSMATPHVAGAAALLMSAFSALKGKPGEVASILRETAVRSGVTDPVTQSCGGIASTVWPNYALGYGRVDALAAYSDVIFIDGFDR
jgi:subtilisin family serine protease